ncbi:hypothetical protein E4U52_007693 [Claviceps spartinae]|nr:hypothetical protein E4U52_007693 [Claviceps spartinae]
MIAPSSFWVSAFLALNYGFTQAKPMDDAMAVAPVATMTIQPVKILTELPVFIRTHCPRPTKIVICHGKTLTVHRPGLFKTVITLTYEQSQTRSRLNCGRSISKTKTPASSAPAVETTSESPSSSGPITSVPTSSTESVSPTTSEPGSIPSGPVSSAESDFPGSFTTSPTTQSVPEGSEEGSVPSDSKTGDKYKYASESASGTPTPESSSLATPFQDKFTSQPSPSSRINIDTAESQSPHTPFPSATTKTYGDYGGVPGASVSESGSSVVSPSYGSRTATSADVPGASVSEASFSVVTPSDGSRTVTTDDGRTKAGPQSSGSADRAGSSQTPIPSTNGEVLGAPASESSTAIVSISDGSRTATTVEVRTKAGPQSSGSADGAGSSQTAIPSTNGEVLGAPASESSTAIVSISDGSRTATTVEVRTKAGPQSSGSADGAGSSQTAIPSTNGDVPGATFSTLQTEKATPTSSSNDDSTPSNFSTSSSPTDKPLSSSSSSNVPTQFTSVRSSSYGPSSFDSSAMVQPTSARSLSVQSDRAQPSNSKGSMSSTPSAFTKVQVRKSSSSGADVSATSTFSTLLTQKARPTSSGNDDSTQSNFAPRSSSAVGGSMSTTDTIRDVSSQTIRVPASRSSGTTLVAETSQSDQSSSASAQSLSRGVPSAPSSNVDGTSSNLASSDTAFFVPPPSLCSAGHFFRSIFAIL